MPGSRLWRRTHLDARTGAAGASARRFLCRGRDGDYQPVRDHGAFRRGHCARASDAGGELDSNRCEELMPKAYDRYFDRLGELLTALRAEGPQIEAAAKLMADCIAAGGVVHVFGSGHSHMMAEEVFYQDRKST